MIETKDIKASFINGDPQIETREDAIRMVGRETVENFEIAVDRNKPFGKRVLAFVKGENRMGRKVGAVLDIATIFLPGGVKTGREAVKTILTKKNKAMPILRDKPWYESKTIWSAIIILITGILQAAGVSFVENPETMQVIYVTIYHVSAALGLYGVRDAVGDKIVNKAT